MSNEKFDVFGLIQRVVIWAAILAALYVIFFGVETSIKLVSLGAVLAGVRLLFNGSPITISM